MNVAEDLPTTMEYLHKAKEHLKWIREKLLTAP